MTPETACPESRANKAPRVSPLSTATTLAAVRRTEWSQAARGRSALGIPDHRQVTEEGWQPDHRLSREYLRSAPSAQLGRSPMANQRVSDS